MRRARTIARNLFVALLCAALALGPVAAMAAAAPNAQSQTSASAMADDMPCHKPCDGCDKGAMSLMCVVACSGLIAAIAPVDRFLSPVSVARRVASVPNDLLAGRQREPDKPPPRLFLA